MLCVSGEKEKGNAWHPVVLVRLQQGWRPGIGDLAAWSGLCKAQGTGGKSWSLAASCSVEFHDFK